MPPHRQQRKFSELSCVTARDGSVVKRGTIVRVDTAAGRRVALVRRLFTRDWDRPHDRGQAHVQYVKRTIATFLDSSLCDNISTNFIVGTVLRHTVSLVAEPGGVWRDPLLAAAHSARGRADPFSPTSCDSCLGAQRKRDGDPNDDARTHPSERNIARAALHRLRPPAVDLYAGGGGLLFGVNKHFNVQHAVEINPAACQTLRDNFPHLTVHRCKVDDYTRRRRRYSAPGSVALLVAGPPCQGYTLGNTSRALGHPLNTEVFTVLKEVEHVKPDVCLIENVPGIATPFPCGTNVLEQVVQRLLSLGYQVRLGQLNSRNYGSPQNRHRIFILAVRSGLPLPAWPAPTHAHGRRKLNLSLGGEPIVLGGNSGADTTRALRPAVTARDAIGDFPEWDYSVLDDRAPNTAARGFDFGDRVGLSDGTPYRCRPKTSYQRAARGGERGEETGVKDHVTQIPAGSCLDLVFSAPKANEPYIGPGNILRCNPHRAVPTIQSNPFPGRNSTLTIHWMSHRVLSVAERRRIQGLPDSYILRGPVKEKDRMLGNMVDVHVADALAAHIKREVFAPSWLAWGRPARDEFWRMWRAAHPV